MLYCDRFDTFQANKSITYVLLLLFNWLLVFILPCFLLVLMCFFFRFLVVLTTIILLFGHPTLICYPLQLQSPECGDGAVVAVAPVSSATLGERVYTYDVRALHCVGLVIFIILCRYVPAFF